MISVVVKYTRPDGSTGSCSCSEEYGERTAASYREQGYRVTVETWEFCDECSGRGTRAHRHNALRQVTCPSCRGKDSERLLKSEGPNADTVV